MATRPTSRDDFEIAVVCALPLEYDAASLAFDEFWDDEGDHYGKAPGDPNTYTTGRIGRFNVVLALLSNMGKVNAAMTMASLLSSYTGLKLALLTGICGGVPNPDNEILLGDVVLSRSIVQYDLGRQYPDRFIRKDTVDDNLGRPNSEIRSLLATFETHRGQTLLQAEAAKVLGQIQEKATKERHRVQYGRPPASEDRLFEPRYIHKHKRPCCDAQACDMALKASCNELQCDEVRLVIRERLEQMKTSEAESQQSDIDIIVGCVGSGDTVMKSGEDRDRIAREHDIVAFEMEGAGVWDGAPSIVVKGVCDYADSHKNKKWQPFAAATAASVMKAILARYIQADKPASNREDATPSPAAPVGGSTVFNGPISGRNVVAGQHTSGGTTTMNFG